MRKLLSSIVGATLLTHCVLADETAKPTEFVPKNGMYTATLPAGEKQNRATQVLRIGNLKAPVEAAQTIQKDGTSYVAASVGIPARAMRNIPADKRFDILRDALMKEIKGKVVEEKDITKDTIAGKEYQIERNKGACRLQLFTVAGWVVYGIVEGKDKNRVTDKQTDEFYESLKFTEEARKIFQDVKR